MILQKGRLSGPNLRISIRKVGMVASELPKECIFRFDYDKISGNLDRPPMVYPGRQESSIELKENSARSI